MRSYFSIKGIGHCVGSQVVSNMTTSLAIGLPPDWLTDHTGIKTRRICGPGENVLSLAKSAVSSALKDAGIAPDKLGHETVLIHIQNGLTHLTPPAGIVLAGVLRLHRVRCLSLDGVCAEPINALEIAALMLDSHLCKRAIISSAVDFMPLVNPKDKNTAGLFGAGAGALVIERCDERTGTGLKGLAWETHAQHWELGVAPVISDSADESGVLVRVGHYKMNGMELARIAIRVLGPVIHSALDEAHCSRKDLGLIISHQPNVKMLKMGLRRLGLPPDIAPIPCADLGNMGPASLLVGLSMAKESGHLRPNQHMLLVSFGLGFSAGAAIIRT